MSEKNNGFSYKDGISLREYIDSRFTNIQQATDLAADNLQLRLESMNEFRNQINKERDDYIKKETYDERHKYLEKQIRSLELSRAELQGKASQSSFYIALFLSLLGLILGILSLWH